MLSSLVASNRSCRAFDRTDPIPRETLLSLIDLARQSASGKNLQPLRYRVLTLETDIFKMLQNCRFAPSLNIPLLPAGKEPTGFILIFSACRNIKNPSKEGFFEYYSTKKALGKDFMA